MVWKEGSKMKMRILLLAIAIAGCVLLGACSANTIRGSGKRISESRPVSGIERLVLAGSGDVILTQGDRESLTVETDDNLMQYITTEVSGGTLTLGTKEGVNVRPTRLRFTLTVKDLGSLMVSGSGEITAQRFDTDDLEIQVSGSGDVRVESLAAQSTKVRISGSGSVELDGQVNGQEIVIGGSGKYRGEDLSSETASVKIDGSGDATVWATGSLDARVAGSGTVRYYGDPQTSFSGAGSGRIRRVGGK
jgi:predicted small secreted protein